MSYAIIRNANYKKDNLAGLYKHNERKNTNYSNFLNIKYMHRTILQISISFPYSSSQKNAFSFEKASLIYYNETRT